MEITGKTFKVIVKPNSPKNEIIGFDKDKDAYIIRIKAAPENNKANIELLKFLSKTLNKKVEIKRGYTHKEKLLSITQ